MTVTVYTKPRCAQCTATVRWLDDKQVPYTTLPAVENVAYIRSLGYQAAPVIVTDTTHWYGFNPDMLNTLLEGTN